MFLKTLKTGLSALLLSLIASPVNASWEFTKWGMTPEELVRAAPNKVRFSSEGCDEKSSPTKKVFTGYWAAHGVVYVVCYIFEDNKLHKLMLVTDEKSKHLEYLSNKYKDAFMKINAVENNVLPSGVRRRRTINMWVTEEGVVMFTLIVDDGVVTSEITTYSLSID